MQKKRPQPGRKAPPGDVPKEFTDAQRGLRLQKALAEAGVASRRHCEELIRTGHVSVNGHIITGLPAWVDSLKDRIEVDGHVVNQRPRRKRQSKSRVFGGDRGKVYVILYKPRHVVSTSSDPERRRTVLDMVPPEDVQRVTGVTDAKRLFLVGRLDAESTGLVLLTNDGLLAQRLTHPRYEVTKKYLVSVKGRLEPAHIEHLQKGLYLAVQGKRSANIRKVNVDKIDLLSQQHDKSRGDRTLLEVTLHQGHNRVIRRMLAHLGLKVRRLRRTAIGPITLKGLALGHWRPLLEAEVRQLRRAVGLETSVGDR